MYNRTTLFIFLLICIFISIVMSELLNSIEGACKEQNNNNNNNIDDDNQLALLPGPQDGTVSSSQNQNQNETINKLTVDGDKLKLDHLGPMIINEDGTIRRIANWESLTEADRNKRRIEELQIEQNIRDEEAAAAARVVDVESTTTDPPSTSASSGSGVSDATNGVV